MSKKMLRRRLRLDLFYFGLKSILKKCVQDKNYLLIMIGWKLYKIKPIKITQMLFIELEITMYLTLSVFQLHIIYVNFPEVILIIWQMLGSMFGSL